MKVVICSVIIAILLVILQSCQTKITKNLIENVRIGFNLPQKNKSYQINTENIVNQGIAFPYQLKNEESNTIENSIKFSFTIQDGKKYYYKIFYQNEEYKFPETDTLSNENFYGSWNDTITGFKEITNKNVIDSFVIIGNPRFEKKFYGSPIENFFVTQEKVDEIIKNIENSPKWKKDIELKSKKNHYSFKEQAIRDALWVLRDKRNHGNINHQWKRNPRMGRYSALIVVCTEKALKNIPEYIQYLHKTNEKGEYVNPYSYFFNKKFNSEGIYLYLDTNIFSLTLSIKPGNGIYIDKTKVPNNCLNFNEDSTCGSSYKLFKKALFEQYFCPENRHFKINTIPVLADWTKHEYTVQKYENNKKKFAKNTLNRVHSWMRNVDCPCNEVKDNISDIEIWNPPSKSIKKAAKQNVGVMTRVGFTYGKITAKVKLPSLLNSSKVWNGITNAIWLITQDLNDWNNRRYSISGYTPKGNPNGKKSHTTSYSEIDFEIVKASPYWPYLYYQDDDLRKKSYQYNGKNNDTIIVALTNWDLACKDPKNFKFPIQYLMHGDKKYEAMRWDEKYQALTIRTPAINQELFGGNYYYFQIEWRPREIIWRIGPSKDKMKEIGYMNDESTNIPNNQMVMVISLGYHLAEWWPPPIFEQDYIPFLKNKNLAKIYEITIE